MCSEQPPLPFHKSSIRSICRSADETRSFAAHFARYIHPGETILLSGELGAGKTTFVQGICTGFGAPDDFLVRSPTFTLMHYYPCPPLKIAVLHVDLYRINSWDEYESIGLYDEAYEDAVTLIEWADKVERVADKKCWQIRLKDLSPNEREIEIVADADMLKLLDSATFSM